MMIFTRHPVDVLRMSDINKITSCHSVKGSYFHCAQIEAKNSGGVVYIVSEKDYKEVKDKLNAREIFDDPDRNFRGIKALARIRLRRFIDVDEGDDFAVPEERYYLPSGDMMGYSGKFVGEILKYCQDNQSIFSEKLSADYIRDNIIHVGGEYTDTNFNDLLARFFNVSLHNKITTYPNKTSAPIVGASKDRFLEIVLSKNPQKELDKEKWNSENLIRFLIFLAKSPDLRDSDLEYIIPIIERKLVSSSLSLEIKPYDNATHLTLIRSFCKNLHKYFTNINSNFIRKIIKSLMDITDSREDYIYKFFQNAQNTKKYLPVILHVMNSTDIPSAFESFFKKYILTEEIYKRNINEIRDLYFKISPIISIMSQMMDYERLPDIKSTYIMNDIINYITRLDQSIITDMLEDYGDFYYVRHMTDKLGSPSTIKNFEKYKSFYKKIYIGLIYYNKWLDKERGGLVEQFIKHFSEKEFDNIWELMFEQKFKQIINKISSTAYWYFYSNRNYFLNSTITSSENFIDYCNTNNKLDNSLKEIYSKEIKSIITRDNDHYYSSGYVEWIIQTLTNNAKTLNGMLSDLNSIKSRGFDIPETIKLVEKCIMDLEKKLEHYNIILPKLKGNI